MAHKLSTGNTVLYLGGIYRVKRIKLGVVTIVRKNSCTGQSMTAKISLKKAEAGYKACHV